MELLVRSGYSVKAFCLYNSNGTWGWLDSISEEIKNEKYTIVYTKLIGTSDRPEVKIDWRVYTKDPEKPLIRDLIIEGLSLARTQKEEFASILSSNNNDINALFKTLEEFSNK